MTQQFARTLRGSEPGLLLAHGIAGVKLVEIDSGHLIADEARDEWLAAIRRFLDEAA